MRKLILYIAQTIDGFIATREGSVEWLNEPDNPNADINAYGYMDFYNSIDTTLIGYNTYNVILNFGIPFPYPDKKNYVFSKNHSKLDDNPVEFISSDIVEFVANLKEEKGKNIWLIGGGQINKILLNANLIDEIILGIKPVVIGQGIKLFADNDNFSKFKISEVNFFDKTFMQIKMIN